VPPDRRHRPPAQPAGTSRFWPAGALRRRRAGWPGGCL